MLLFCGHIWGSKRDLPFKLQFGNKISQIFYCILKLLTILCLAPLVELLSLGLFIFYVKFSVKYHFLWNQYKTIAGTICTFITMVLVTYMYLTGVLPPPW